MELIMLGTGNAGVTECYNTCFALRENGKVFLTDATGGIGITGQLKKSGISYGDITDIFLTHRHTDHIVGMAWIFRNIASSQSPNTIDIYGCDVVISVARTLAEILFNKTQQDNILSRVRFHVIEDGDRAMILNHPITFFDIHSTKEKQFGYTYWYDDVHKLTCCGDEPYCPENHNLAVNSRYMLHEAFCLYGQADIFKPYQKHHSTVREACQRAEELGIENLILYHTEEKNLAERKKLYTEEGRQFFSGNLFVPDDLDIIELE
ncbi:MAG: MBL fold metallo-hydrolase [Erysipelotrichaceae bacterium]|nr:MBL fold metallo-hydrolase [Erysipelotrichaceae bacterium]